MNRMTMILMALCLASSVFATERPSAQTILTRAGESRVEFRRALEDMERFAPTLTSSEEAYPYLLILNDLKALADRYNVDQPGYYPVKNTAVVLTRHSRKWINLKLDSVQLLESFFTWAEDQTRYDAVEQQRGLIMVERELVSLLEWQGVVERGLVMVSVLRVQPNVLKELEKLQDLITQKALKLNLSDEQFVQLVESVTSEGSLEEIGQYLRLCLYDYNSSAELASLLTKIQIFARVVETSEMLLPSYLRNLPTQLALDFLGRFLRSDLNLSAQQGQEFVRSIQAVRLPEVVQTLVDYKRVGFNKNHSEFLFQVAKDVSAAYQRLGIYNGARELEELLRGFSLLKLNATYELEGDYTVDVDGRETILTVVKTDATNLCFLFKRNLESSSLQYSMCHVYYNLSTDTYTAYRYQLVDSQIPSMIGYNYKFEFKITPVKDGSKDVNFVGYLTTNRELTVDNVLKQKHYPGFKRGDSLVNQALAGTYQGVLANGDAVEFTVYQNNSMLSAVVSFPGIDGVTQLLPYGGMDSAVGVYYFTSEQIDNSSFMQVRGQFFNNMFNGYYMVAGSGELLPLNLTKVQ